MSAQPVAATQIDTLARSPRARSARAIILALAATVVLLTLSFPPFKLWPAAWLAVAPLAWVAARHRFGWAVGSAIFGAGALFWIANLFWLEPITGPGYVLLALYMGIYFPLFALPFRVLFMRGRWPATLALPVVWVVIEYVRSTWPQGGFAWFLLGNSQAPAAVLIQGADLLGVWLVSFFICMVNGLWVDLATRHPQRKLWAAVVAILAIAWVGYGIWRLNQQTQHPGPRIAVIQENIPQAVKDSGDHDDDVFDKHYVLTQKALAGAPKPDLVVWPETMVPGWTNKEFINAPAGTFDHFPHPENWPIFQADGRGYREELEHLSTRASVSLLLGTEAIIPGEDWAHSRRENRTTLLDPLQGEVANYAKIHLVPFGEYIPWRDVPGVGWVIRVCSPYGDFDYSCTPGREWTRFPLKTPGGVYSFATPICFEDTMPAPPRAMAAAGDGRGKADFLVSVSNDGWFHWVQLDQHLQATQLRAVEERVWIARSVNTGDSGFVDSCGRVAGLVRDSNGRTAGAIGVLAMEVGVDSRVTLYSRLGDVLPALCGAAAVVGLGVGAVRRRR